MQTREQTGMPTSTEWRENWRRLQRHDRDAYPSTMGPPDVFTDDQATAHERVRCGHPVPEDETGPNSRTVANRLRMSCTEWQQVPGPQEFHQAVHHPRGTSREAAMLLVWYHEADMSEQVYAQLENAYTWRSLVTALHRTGLVHGEGARRINRFATR